MCASRRQMVSAPCKVNLHLGVYPQKDERGYHRVDSVMIPLDLANTIAIEDADSLVVAFHPAIDNMTHSAAVRAATFLANELGIRPDVRIDIQRRIPEMGGLGSSSADAGCILRALAERWGIDPLDQCVVAIAKRIGADVPFCLNPAPALYTGAGDTFAERFPDLVGVPIALVMPAGSGSSTREVYGEFDRTAHVPESPERMCAALRAGDIAGVAASLYNNLAPAAKLLQPSIAMGEKWLLSQPGVVAGQVTGSGSCSFAICESAEAAEKIEDSAKNEQGWWAKAVLTVGLDARFC
jgi:4-diphosphocytidyl-2-C-methyl-D-erythritol kinase